MYEDEETGILTTNLLGFEKHMKKRRFEMKNRNNIDWFPRLAIAWVVFCLVAGATVFSAVAYVAYKMLTHFGIL